MKVQIEVFEEPEPLEEKMYDWIEFEIKKSDRKEFVREVNLLKRKFSSPRLPLSSIE